MRSRRIRQILPWLVGVVTSASLIAAGALPSISDARADAPTAAVATPAASPTVTPSPTPKSAPVAPAMVNRPAKSPPTITRAEREASAKPFKDPLRELGTCEMRFSAVGASFTQANSEDVVDDGKDGSWMAEGKVGNRSWAYWANEDPQLLLDGGWAQGGLETSDIAERVQRSWFPVDTNLVILLGTNNLLHGTPINEAPADIERIVRTSGISPDRVYLVQLPPSNVTPEKIGPYNKMLATTAAENGFHLVDVSTFLDSGSGSYRQGATNDGIHLTRDNAQRVGRSIAAAINANSGCQRLPAFDEMAAEHDLGDPVDVPHCELPDGGCVQLFQRGALRRSNAGDPTLLPARVTKTWRDFGVAALGNPIENPNCEIDADACRTRFELGTMYSTDDEAFVVRGDILRTYRDQGSEEGSLGVPTAEEICDDDGCSQAFEGGTIEWTPTEGAEIEKQ